MRKQQGPPSRPGMPELLRLMHTLTPEEREALLRAHGAFDMESDDERHDEPFDLIGIIREALRISREEIPFTAREDQNTTNRSATATPLQPPARQVTDEMEEDENDDTESAEARSPSSPQDSD